MSLNEASQIFTVTGEMRIQTLSSLGQTKGRITFLDQNQNEFGSFRVFGEYPFGRLIMDSTGISSGTAFKTQKAQGTLSDGGTGQKYAAEINTNGISTVALSLTPFNRDPNFGYSDRGQPLIDGTRNTTTDSVNLYNSLADFRQNTFKASEKAYLTVGRRSGPIVCCGLTTPGGSNPLTDYGFLGIATSSYVSPTESIKLTTTGNVEIPYTLTVDTINATNYTNLPAVSFLPLTLDTTNNYVGINKTIPTEALDVVGNGTFTGTVTSNQVSATTVTADTYVNLPPVNFTPITLDTTNTRVGINNPTPSYTLDINGNCNLAAGNKYLINGVPLGLIDTTISSPDPYVISNTDLNKRLIFSSINDVYISDSETMDLYSKIGIFCLYNQVNLQMKSNGISYANINFNNIVVSLASQSDQKLIIAGNYTTVNGVWKQALNRLTKNGVLDTTFSAVIGTQISTQNVQVCLVQSDGKIVIGGNFTLVNSTTRTRIARLNSDGTLDTTFNPSASSTVQCLSQQSDGKIILGGVFVSVSTITRNRIARLNTDGSLDTSFNPDLNGICYTIGIQSTGKIIIGGGFTTVGGTTQNYIARLNSDGSLDSSFNANINGGIITSLQIFSDDSIFIGGYFTTVGGVSHSYCARLNSDGTRNATFVPIVNASVECVYISPSSEIFIGGNFTTINSTAKNYCAKVNIDGSLDASFIPNCNNVVYSIHKFKDRELALGGSFTTLDSITRNNFGIISYKPAATIRSSYTPSTTVLSQYTSIELEKIGTQEWCITQTNF